MNKKNSRNDKSVDDTISFSNLTTALRLSQIEGGSESSEIELPHGNQHTDLLRQHPSCSTDQRNDSVEQHASCSRNQRSDFSRQSTGQAVSNEPFIPTIGLKLDDIIAAFKPFKGDNHSNIEKWLLHFQC